MAKIVAAKPDVLVSGTQSDDAYAQVKSLVQLKFSPKFMFMSNGANSPVEFPDKVGAANVAGIMSAGDWFPNSTAFGSADFTAAYIKAYGGTADTIDNSSAEAYAAGQLLEAVAKQDREDRQRNDHRDPAPGHLADPARRPVSWDANGAPNGSFNLIQWQDGKLVPVFPAATAKATPVYPKPNWGG